MSTSNRSLDDATQRQKLTKELSGVAGSDGARWADPRGLEEGADERANAIAPYISSGVTVLDLGAGLAKLGDAVAERCHYQALDLIPFIDGAIVLDLNRSSLPEQYWDVMVAGGILEYLHHPEILAAEVARRAEKFICTYPTKQNTTVAQRRQRGWFNHFSENQMRAMLATAGWNIVNEVSLTDSQLYVCERR